MTQFNGFPQEGLDFLCDLGKNNNKTWFNAHKGDYEKFLLEPAKEFVVALGERLQSIAPNIQYDTRTNGQGTLMRIYRDTRFSKDKTPYKTAIAGVFWQGAGKKMQNPGFGFHMESQGMELMAGMFGFSKDQLENYRSAVAADGSGEELRQIITSLGEKRGYGLVGSHYKRVPRGYPADHPRGDLLKFKGFYVHPLESVPAEKLITPELVDICLDRLQIMAPVQRWLVQYVTGN